MFSFSSKSKAINECATECFTNLSTICHQEQSEKKNQAANGITQAVSTVRCEHCAYTPATLCGKIIKIYIYV